MRKMRLIDCELSNEKALEILQKGVFGTLAISDVEGYAYSVPLNYVMLSDTLYFHCAKEGKKLEGIIKNPSVSFSVVTVSNIKDKEFTTEYESVIVFGKAYKVEVEEEIMDTLKALILKYSPEYLSEGDLYIQKFKRATQVVGIKVSHFTAKAND
ncbi:MAG: pyridoxamine 5'-phosphate oxidase family protein [Fusobacteria bacterium]|nr:pyridoxamine 5'-phosphate oxidase family protein [Fusobacteriota bacterium]